MLTRIPDLYPQLPLKTIMLQNGSNFFPVEFGLYINVNPEKMVQFRKAWLTTKINASECFFKPKE